MCDVGCHTVLYPTCRRSVVSIIHTLIFTVSICGDTLTVFNDRLLRFIDARTHAGVNVSDLI